MKKKRKLKKIEIKKITIAFVVSLFLMSVGFSYLEETLSIEATVNLKIASKNPIDHEINYQVNRWASGNATTYQYNTINLKYLGDIRTYGWRIIVNVPNDTVLGNCWNVSCNLADGSLELSNVSFNGVMEYGNIASFGVEITTSLTNYDLSIEKVKFFSSINPDPNEIILDSGIEALINRTNSWSDIVVFSVNLNNSSGLLLNYWEVGLKKNSNAKISSMWGSSYIETDDLIILTGSTVDKSFPIGANKTVELHIQTNDPNFTLHLDYVHGRSS